ncbi:uncharacterized protein KY384_000198 [Bacidia gigantensis]|uniref:uncharacterized protein n=1 Tax=Bacidia gigantensis TaxID=2732470 RepID=UPI001D04D8FF|nr:uncharacterized protein KY384_000198 [Bacidia gigantensis]KAG8526205.1 hypothetical protein KY384_000198 [Bacidia gigantensis]
MCRTTFNMAPPKNPNTTILKLDHLEGKYTIWDRPDSEDAVEEITDQTAEGKALFEFMAWLRSVMIIALRFSNDSPIPNPSIGWDEYTSEPFDASKSIKQVLDSGQLAALQSHLSNPPEVMNIPSRPPLGEGLAWPRFSCEWVTWSMPSKLDPTYHEKAASQFDALGDSIKSTQSMPSGSKQRDLAGSYRGWLYNDESAAPVSIEPSEKTHIFCFLWRNSEAEMNCKNYKVDRELRESWHEDFAALEHEWEAMGMRSESVHLQLGDFGHQLRWLEQLAKVQSRDLTASARSQGMECVVS